MEHRSTTHDAGTKQAYAQAAAFAMAWCLNLNVCVPAACRFCIAAIKLDMRSLLITCAVPQIHVCDRKVTDLGEIMQVSCC